MNIVEVLRMNGGIGETSYAINSLVQRNVIHMTKPIIDLAKTRLYTSPNNPKTISIADLGCSSGPNTLLAVSNLVKAVDNHRKKLGRRHSPEFRIYINDLLTNDFNTIFQSLPEHHRKEIGDGSGLCFFNGVPDSFHGGFSPPEASILFILLIVSIGYLNTAGKHEISDHQKVVGNGLYPVGTRCSDKLSDHFRGPQMHSSLFPTTTGSGQKFGPCNIRWSEIPDPWNTGRFYGFRPPCGRNFRPQGGRKSKNPGCCDSIYFRPPGGRK